MSDDSQEIHDLLKATIDAHRSNPVQGLALANEAIARATALGLESELAKAYRVRAMCHGAKGDLDNAIADFSEALCRSLPLQDKNLEAQCLHGIGLAHFYRTEYALALEKMYEALTLRRLLGRDSQLAATLNGLAAVHGTLGNYPEATACTIEAFDIAQSEGSLIAAQASIGHTGILRAEMGDHAGAITAYEESIRLAEELNHPLNLAGTLGNYSTSLMEMGRDEDAIAAAQRSVAVATELGNVFHIAQAHLKLAMVEEKLGHLDRVEAIYQDLLDNIGRGERDTHSVGILLEAAAFYFRQNHYAATHTALATVYSQLNQEQENKFLSEYHLLLSNLHEAEGNFKASLEHHREFYRLSENLQKQAAENLLVAQTAKLEVERARQEAEIERLKNVELVEANRQKSELLEKLQKQAELLAKQAITDPLTGLYNRRYLHHFLERELAEAWAGKTPFAVLIGDLDNFKQINDRFSHATGDVVLKTVALLFRQAFRDTDMIARYGGEEFVVALPRTNATQTSHAAERVRRAIEAYAWADVHPELVVTISIGIADESLDNADHLLALSDKRLYEAKRAGKNRVVYGI